jgi:hypothetical protein
LLNYFISNNFDTCHFFGVIFLDIS